MGLVSFWGIHKIDVICCEEGIAVILDFIFCYLLCQAASLFFFLLYPQKKKRTKKEKVPAVTTKLLRVSFVLKRTNALATLT